MWPDFGKAFQNSNVKQLTQQHYHTSKLSITQTTQGWFFLFWVVWQAHQAVNGLVKDLASRESVVNGRMDS